MSQILDFQSIIMRLQSYWAEQGCLIWQPYHTEVGAGTMNPATCLRVLGPEPWNVAYVEPSIRPDDGRYGENPNRFYQHYQFQVILKPDPGNPQELYLKSLEALGIDPRSHDIRFVEDNWESPALGAWGLGWEVWLDGQEITQFTYFQQAGGQILDPVSVELTYGLERIAMALQGVRDFRDIRWNEHLTYGDVHLQSEQEFSRYSFDVADVGRLRQAYDVYRAEAELALAQGLVLPAHDYILKCSHTFNVLDTRGAIGVTERQALFGQMRDLSRRAAQAYLEQRQRLEYPWLEERSPVKTIELPSLSEIGYAVDSAVAEIAASDREPFLLEIGVEELPPRDLDDALSQLRQQVPAMLDDLRLDHGEVSVLGTPRRLVVFVESLATQQRDLEQIVKGPPAERAFGSDGLPTQAGVGFARSKGIALEQLEVREMDGGKYAVAVVRQAGQVAKNVLTKTLPELVGGLKFEKSMRWNYTNVAFSRPVRWLLALLGNQVLPFTFAGLQAGRTTFGLRFRAPEIIEVDRPETYFTALQTQGILLDPEQRRAAILEGVRRLAEQVSGAVPDDPPLLDEVTHLVESPTPLLGQFEPEYLTLPREVLISVMKKHQRYFPVTQKDGDDAPLLPYFIAVRNGDEYSIDIVRQGNADVIRARFADANYFVRADSRMPLEAYLPKLANLTFQKDLGSMLDKSMRLEKLVGLLAPLVGLSKDELAIAQRAAKLSKADLVTQMVVEMTSLQGIMGRYYALNSGENSAVAEAIYEHYLPRFAGDELPASRAGLVLSLADRLDSLAGLFSVGLAPTGTKDPYAQRRTALGLVQTLVAWDLHVDLYEALELAAQLLPTRPEPDAITDCLTFIVERLRNVLLDQGYRFDVVDAVVAAQGRRPASASQAVKELSNWVARPDWHEILPAYARCVRITRDKTEIFQVIPEAFVEPEEKQLCDAIKAFIKAERRAGSVDDFLLAFLPLIPPINDFFDRVLVMAEDPLLRANRLGMLQVIAKMADGVADFSRLEGF